MVYQHNDAGYKFKGITVYFFTVGIYSHESLPEISQKNKGYNVRYIISLIAIIRK